MTTTKVYILSTIGGMRTRKRIRKYRSSKMKAAK